MKHTKLIIPALAALLLVGSALAQPARSQAPDGSAPARMSRTQPPPPPKPDDPKKPKHDGDYLCPTLA